MISNAKELIDKVNKEKVIIYGAGKVSTAVIEFLEENYSTENVFGIATTKTSEEKDIKGLKIYAIELLKDYTDYSVIIATKSRVAKEIEQTLTILKFSNVECLEDEFCNWLLKRTVKTTEGPEIPSRRLWSNDLERNLIRENWGRVMSESDFSDKYLRLINGLDEESIVRITRILQRQEKYLSCDKDKMDIFTEQEQRELQELEENFYDLILKLSDNLYAYKNYLLPIHRFSPSVLYYKHGLSEVESVEQVKGKTIIDVGAHIGDSVLILSDLEPSKIIAFEAVPEHVKMFNKTMELNHINNAKCEPVALGKESGYIKICLAGAASTAANRKGIDFQGEIEVPVTSLDEYVEANNVDDIALIKVDIEGSEPAFLAGARKTIEKYKPIILLSIYHNAHDFFELKPMIESWNLGYQFKIYKPTDGNLTSETLLIAEIK